MMSEPYKTFLTYVSVIVLIYIAQTLFKISSTRKDGTFDFKKLIDGIIDYAIYFVGIMVFFFAGCLIPDFKTIPINGNSFSITDGLTLIAVALIGIQSVKCFKNIKETFSVKDSDIKGNNDELTGYGNNG